MRLSGGTFSFDTFGPPRGRGKNRSEKVGFFRMPESGMRGTRLPKSRNNSPMLRIDLDTESKGNDSTYAKGNFCLGCWQQCYWATSDRRSVLVRDRQLEWSVGFGSSRCRPEFRGRPNEGFSAAGSHPESRLGRGVCHETRIVFRQVASIWTGPPTLSPKNEAAIRWSVVVCANSVCVVATRLT
jgi:hypothetical protein